MMKMEDWDARLRVAFNYDNCLQCGRSPDFHSGAGLRTAEGQRKWDELRDQAREDESATLLPIDAPVLAYIQAHGDVSANDMDGKIDGLNVHQVSQSIGRLRRNQRLEWVPGSPDRGRDMKFRAKVAR